MHRRQVRVVVVRRNVELMRLRQQRDIPRARKPLPRYVDHHNVHRADVEVRAIVADRDQILPRGYRAAGAILDLAQTVWLIHVDLHPHHVELLQHPAYLNGRLGLHVEVQVQRNLNVISDRFLECPNVLLYMPQQRRRYRLIWGTAPAAEAVAITQVIAAEKDDVRLQRPKTAIPHFMPQVSNRLERIHRRCPDQLVITRARRAAM